METKHSDKLTFIEKFFINSGKIVDVRSWEGGNIYEIDVYLPNVDFTKWDKTQSIKCRITALHYIDYTPSMWNAEKKICRLYVDTNHGGEGSIWTKNQVVGNNFYYLKIEAVKHVPIESRHLVFIGDQTSIGHFCLLYQLSSKETQISGYISFNDVITSNAFIRNCPWLPLKTVLGNDEVYRQTEDWLNQNRAKEKGQFVFYIVGNAEMVVRLRKLLKAHGFEGGQIKSKGFWH